MSGRDDALDAAVCLGVAASRGLLRSSLRAARSVPGVGLGIDLTAAAEKAVLREIAGVLDEARGERLAAELTPGPVVSEEVRVPSSKARIDLAARLDELMRLSVEQTADDARHELFTRILESLVPDEMRILSALADGDIYPVLHVVTRGRPGHPAERLLENASSVGRAAGVRLPDLTHVYVTHLRDVGLVRIDPESPSLADGYEILSTEHAVRAASGTGHVRLLRRTLRLSDLGRQLWAACREVAG